MSMRIRSNAFGSFGEVAKNQLGIDPTSLIEDIGTSIPGIDEAMAFSEVLKIINTMNFKVVVFDTAPTGHTLRLLGLPSMIDKALEKFSGLQNKFSGVMSQFQNMFGMNMNEEQMQSKWTSARDSIKEVNEQFKNPDATTFVVGGSSDFWARVYDFSTGKELEVHKGHHGPVHCVHFAPDGATFASGSEDGTIRLWQSGDVKAYGLWQEPPKNDTTNATNNSNNNKTEVEN